jgi:hypothetical protein
LCAYKEQYPSASQHNIATDFSLWWGKPIIQRCVGDILIKKKVSIYHHPCFNSSIGGGQSVVL